MNDIIKFCEQNLSDSEINFAKDFFKNASPKSLSSLNRLCPSNKSSAEKDYLKIAVLRHIIAAEIIKQGDTKEKNREIIKQRKKKNDEFLKLFVRTANKAIKLRPLNRDQIKQKFIELLSDINQIPIAIPADEPLKMGITYNWVMRDLFETLQKNTSHTDNAIYDYLCNLLNNLGCTPPQGSSFYRQQFRSLIS